MVRDKKLVLSHLVRDALSGMARKISSVAKGVCRVELPNFRLFPSRRRAIGQSTAYWGGMARNLWLQEALDVRRVRKVYGWNSKKRP
jgi:hypothetical protein